jgi:hypothetical protein
MGDEGAIVCALQLAPNQIRIGAQIARPPDRGRPPTVPEVAKVHEGRIIVERWNAQKRPKLSIGGWKLDVRDLNLRLKAFFGSR